MVRGGRAYLVGVGAHREAVGRSGYGVEGALVVQAAHRAHLGQGVNPGTLLNICVHCTQT